MSCFSDISNISKDGSAIFGHEWQSNIQILANEKGLMDLLEDMKFYLPRKLCPTMKRSFTGVMQPFEELRNKVLIIHELALKVLGAKENLLQQDKENLAPAFICYHVLDYIKQYRQLNFQENTLYEESVETLPIELREYFVKV